MCIVWYSMSIGTQFGPLNHIFKTYAMVRVSAFLLSNYMHIGSVKLLKGSVASSPREKRNARKRSFEQCMSATAAKILKMEQERETLAGEKVNSWYDGMYV